jgi:hypothetical protein
MERGAVRVRGARGDGIKRDVMRRDGRSFDRMNRMDRMGLERWVSGRETVASALDNRGRERS